MTVTAGAAPRPGEALGHEALYYRTVEEFLTGTLRFVRGGLAAGEPVFVAVPGPKVDLLRAGLKGSAGQVRFADMTEVGRNPDRIIPAVRQFTAAHAGRRVRFVGEPIWPGRSAAEICEGTRHEALLNTAFAATPITIVCPYDAVGLSPAVLADAARTHPVVVRGGRRRRSPAYTDPARVLAGDRPLPEPPGDVAVLPFDRGHLPVLRRLVRQRAGLTGDRADNLLLAVNEVATNSCLHAGEGGVLRIWQDPERDGVVCEVRDRGHITDPLAGRHLPTVNAEQGRGLWLANQVCDLVEIRSDDRGSTVRLHVRPG